ncbi:MAG TPA: hypothetical protein VFQ53_41260 [Kofleriaceae bacterium]|nr:hypothetical protein [Kofleriaceae bacterium]
MPTAKQTILDLIANDPLGVRDAFKDKALVKALDGIGVVVNPPEVGVRALHAPGPGAMKNSGVGKTLCGRDRGHRHPAGVTCSYCLKRLAKP